MHFSRLFLLGLLTSLTLCAQPSPSAPKPPARKVKDVIIYKNDRFHCAFPSVVRLPNGEIYVAFRRALERRALGEKGTNHTDPNSYLVAVRSRDEGETWSAEPELVYAHPFGGSQDPCLLQLRDGTLLCASYGWMELRPDGLANVKKPSFILGNFAFLGGYLIRSTDNGKTWGPTLYPAHVREEINVDPYGTPVPAYNRGALWEGKDGRVFWVAQVNDRATPRKHSNHLMISSDKGLTWEQAGAVAVDDKITFNETSIYETPKGDLVAFMRTADFDDHACLARSKDGGKTFLPWEDMGFQGHPLQALRLPDERVLIVYGYRHVPGGIRARILNAECTDYKTAPEIVLRDDAGKASDIGYPWAVQLDPKRVLVTYYINLDNGVRHIAGTVLELE